MNYAAEKNMTELTEENFIVLQNNIKKTYIKLSDKNPNPWTLHVTNAHNLLDFIEESDLFIIEKVNSKIEQKFKSEYYYIISSKIPLQHIIKPLKLPRILPNKTIINSELLDNLLTPIKNGDGNFARSSSFRNVLEISRNKKFNISIPLLTFLQTLFENSYLEEMLNLPFPKMSEIELYETLHKASIDVNVTNS